MRAFLALLGKHLHESRWTLLGSTAAVFALGWLSVYMTSRNETAILKMLSSGEEGGGRMQWMRSMGVESSSVSIMMAFWNHPFFLLLIAIWGIGRGSGAVAAEVERGTLDMVLSRPISRFEYLASQVSAAVLGLGVLATALTLGAWIAVRYNVLQQPPSVWSLLKPSINLAALGLPIYGYSLLASSSDSVRWRPTWIGSVLTLAGFIAFVMVNLPVFKDEWWKPWLERVSIFKRYNPVELVAKAETFEANVAVLLGVGSACIAVAFVVFSRRDLPANG
jgi:ABC-2 type transport system permease protein